MSDLQRSSSKRKYVPRRRSFDRRETNHRTEKTLRKEQKIRSCQPKRLRNQRLSPLSLFFFFQRLVRVRRRRNRKIRSQFDTRRSNLEKILGPLDFYQDRNLVLGAASYLLAIECYQNRKASVAPTPKKAVCSVRGAWYFEDLNNDFPNMGFDKVRDLLYQKAAGWYTETMEIMQSGSEPVDQASYILGPDTDKNWAFDGVIYLSAYLTMKFKDELAPDPAAKLNLLVRAKRTLSRLYGSGKGSKSKPSVIIDMAKELYDEYNKLIEEMGGEK